MEEPCQADVIIIRPPISTHFDSAQLPQSETVAPLTAAGSGSAYVSKRAWNKLVGVGPGSSVYVPEQVQHQQVQLPHHLPPPQVAELVRRTVVLRKRLMRKRLEAGEWLEHKCHSWFRCNYIYKKQHSWGLPGETSANPGSHSANHLVAEREECPTQPQRCTQNQHRWSNQVSSALLLMRQESGRAKGTGPIRLARTWQFNECLARGMRITEPRQRLRSFRRILKEFCSMYCRIVQVELQGGWRQRRSG